MLKIRASKAIKTLPEIFQQKLKKQDVLNFKITSLRRMEAKTERYFKIFVKYFSKISFWMFDVKKLKKTQLIVEKKALMC